jgi:hypothetical protein
VAKITSIKPHFENMAAFLAHIAEDPEAIGFAGIVLQEDGNAVPVSFNMSRAEIAYASVILAATVTTDEME